MSKKNKWQGAGSTSAFRIVSHPSGLLNPSPNWDTRSNDPISRAHRFQSYISACNRSYSGNLKVTLKNWITINDGAEWAKEQVREYTAQVLAAHRSTINPKPLNKENK